ncbi:MAG TPA: His/Gly/Thr/Pro-type tRNA ligase C-terminal domain-containing protein, partial [Puia sp.]|nr:His/Gly/Thr/Pro-type tRNA ligase C-terminal domain-containing protein [Puia sp.]
NHRKVLAALAGLCGGPGNLITITTAIDKLDKIGPEKVKEELRSKGLDDQQISTVENYLAISGSNEQKLEQLEKILSSGSTGIEDIRYLLGFFPDNKHIVLDFSLARGLNYYTGIIFEVRAKNVSIGSIGGGGRYDDLTGLFGVPNVPGVGISFGVDRIYDVLEELKLFPAGATRSATALFFNLAPEAVPAILDLMNRLHTAGIGCELFPDAVKFDKQFRYAEKKRIPFAVIIGADELKSWKAKVKSLNSGKQEECPFDDLAAYFFRDDR